MRLQVFGIFIGGIDIFDTFPFIRSLTCAYTDGVSVEIGLVDMQTQTVHTVAPETGGEMITVFATSVQCSRCDDCTALGMSPCIRQFRISDINDRVVPMVREDIQT